MIRSALLSATLAATCSPARGPIPQPAAATLAAAARSRDIAMVDTLRTLAALLARDPLTLEQVAQQLGTVEKDHGPGAPVELRGRDPRFARVQILRDMSSGVPFLIDIVLAPKARFQVADLRRAFGPCEDATPSAIGATRQVVFNRVTVDRAYTAAVLARIEGEPSRLDENMVTAVQIVRDRRLD